MNNTNNIFRKVASSPMLLWNAAAAIILISLGLAILVVPSLTGADSRLQFGLGGMLTVYGFFRFWTFYRGINDRRDA